jgi:hypothetical protein
MNGIKRAQIIAYITKIKLRQPAAERRDCMGTSLNLGIEILSAATLV